MATFLKALSILLFTFHINAAQLPSCNLELGYFSKIKEQYLSNKVAGVKAVKCMAYAGDDRAATLYAEHLVEKYNNIGKRDIILEAYAWYRLSIERAKTIGEWMQMISILENSMPGIKQDSKTVYLEIKNTIASRKRFDKKFNVTFNIENKKSNIGKTTVGSRIPNDKRKIISGNVKIETGGSLGSAGAISADVLQQREVQPKTQILIKRENYNNENEEKTK